MGVPTVNIGDRQRGRRRASSVIDCDETPKAILEALNKATSDAHQLTSKDTINPYGEAGASAQICTHLKNVELEGVLMKRFYDIPVAL
mgnify:CR=1 FL=1